MTPALLIFIFCVGLSFCVQDRTSFAVQDRTKVNGSRKLKETLDLPERTLFGLNRFHPPLVEGKVSYCTRPAKCEELNYTTCMGAKLPYTKTTLELVDGLSSQEQAQEQLEEWKRLVQHIPKCWQVIQSFLCSIYMPKCDNGEVFLPSLEMCNATLGPCRILATYQPWPSIFRCDNQTRYPTRCKNDVRELKYNTPGKCMEPLVQTDLSAWYYDGVEGCGIQCDDPMFTNHQRDQIHKMVAWAATICALNNLFAVLTFMIDWKFANKYPALAIFYINLCFLIVCMGWLAQFLPGGREDIVCRKDGTLRIAEPSAGENLSCVVVYVMVYYFLMAGIVWFVILTYAWNLSLQALGKIQERMDKKGAYFHMVAWSLPLVLTITTMALGEIDGDSVTGICFVGTVNDEYRAGFLLLPVAAALTIGTYFLAKGLFTLIRLKVDSEEIISQRASAKIRETILRVGIFSVLVITFGATTFICHIYEFRNGSQWTKSFRTYILCRLGVGELGSEGECRMSSRPSLAMLQLHILSLFVTGILMSSWVWTQTTLNTWTHFIAKLFNRDIENRAQRQTKPLKHKLIAQAYSKRKDLEEGGRLSLTFGVSREDPVGLGFELYSGGSGSVRSSWAAALPKFVTRRGAFVPNTNSNSSVRRNSIDSQISYSVRRVSVESRRHSVDSAVSVKVSEVTQTLVKKVSTPLHKHRIHRGGRASRKYSKSKGRKTSGRHNRNSASASSNDSNLAIQQLMLNLALADSGGAGPSSQPNLRALGFNGISKPKLGRRKANAGLENINNLALLADKLSPWNKQSSSSSSSSSRTTGKSSQHDIQLDILRDIDPDLENVQSTSNTRGE
ncbi:protein smoothened [Cimex lectularius]|uniref:Protein smoothened n=1 Tax=Cimex lectularius TaxID=79782 RepID=A0A8I6R6N4_CIMLE|nr:protein smoothened [Cimex lectularius]